MRIALAQLDQRVGDLAANVSSLREALGAARAAGAAILVTPELSVCGYPPEDLLLRREFVAACREAVDALAHDAKGLVMLVGFPELEDGRRYNAVAVLRDGRVEAVARKACLPNDTVFDEARYFTPGDAPCVVEVDGLRCGVLVCEDVWWPEPARRARDAGAQLLLVPNASPYHTEQQALRARVVGERARDVALPVVYVNRVGGQDELVFDGASFVADASGAISQQLPAWHACLAVAELDGATPRPVRGGLDAALEPNVYDALVLGVRDYVRKNGFPGVVLGLSGGIDSALTLAIAADAVGAAHVHAVMLPSPYTSTMSVEDARAMAGTLGVRYDEMPITATLDAALEALRAEREGHAMEENLQARIRGMLLMALSNRDGTLLLSTGNKSELAVGYATLYGDMAGGFAVLKDVTKGLVYRLARYRNALGEVIPERVLTRAPSAELRPDQADQDVLPPYDLVDAIIAGYVEEQRSVDELRAAGVPLQALREVVRRIERNEFKRRQAAPGVRVSSKAFGKDRRLPITNRWSG